MIRCPHCGEKGIHGISFFFSDKIFPAKCKICGKFAMKKNGKYIWAIALILSEILFYLAMLLFLRSDSSLVVSLLILISFYMFPWLMAIFVIPAIPIPVDLDQGARKRARIWGIVILGVILIIGLKPKLDVVNTVSRSESIPQNDTRDWAKRELPRFTEYGTDMKSVSKYLYAIENTPIEVCQAAFEKKSADGAFCLSQQNIGYKKFSMLNQSAKLGHPLAMNNLAMYLSRLKRPELAPDIRQLFLSAAQSGIPHAQVSVGWGLMTGENGFAVNYAEAMEWNLKGYKQGHSEGANNIGQLYENGYGVEKDINTAKSWYQKASELGNSEAAASIKRLNK